MTRALIGILALDTAFPRIPGDVGNAETWPFPVRIATVSGATPGRVVHDRAQGLFEAFVAAGNQLAGQGVATIVTTCGFLALVQQELAAALPVPVATSALLQAPLIARTLPAGRRVGIITASERALTPAHLAAAGADPATPVVGVAEGGAFSRTFVGNGTALDVAAAEADVLAESDRLLSEHADIGAILLECANMGPYAAAVRAATSLPVHDMVGFVHWLHGALVPRVFKR